MDERERRERFAAWLSRELGRTGWSVSELGRRAQVPRQTADTWVRATRLPGSESCHMIASALGIPAAVVLLQAGHLENVPSPVSEYERERTLRRLEEQLQSAIKEMHGVTPATISTHIRVIGVIPADAVRWTAIADRGETVNVPAAWVEESSRPLFAVRVSGDCLRSLGVVDGDTVICEEPEDPSTAKNGQIVVVRIGDDYTMKVWQRRGDGITLLDGDANVVHELSLMDDYLIMGVKRYRFGE